MSVYLHVTLEVVSELCLQSLKLRSGIFVVSFKLCELLQLVKIFLRLLVVLEIAHYETSFQFIEIVVAYHELVRFCNGWMSVDVVVFVVEHHFA